MTWVCRIDDWPYSDLRWYFDDYRRKYLELLSPLEELEVPYLLAVTPALITAEDVDALATLKHAEIAMHGWDHAHDRPGERYEFRDHKRADIEEKLRRGLKRLRRFAVRTYVPTFNSVSDELFAALEDVAISHCTVGPEWPEIAHHYHVPKSLRLHVPPLAFYARAHQILPAVVDMQHGAHVTLHITWELREAETDGTDPRQRLRPLAQALRAHLDASPSPAT